MLEEYNAFSAWAGEQGWIIGGEALQDVSTATTVTVRDGRRIVTDGPFAETKEHLGGYYLIDVPSLDDAIEAASRIPGARSAGSRSGPSWRSADRRPAAPGPATPSPASSARSTAGRSRR